MSILKYKYKAHNFINYIFYIIVFLVGFLIGFSTEKINFSKLISQVLMIDNAQALDIGTIGDYTITDEFIYNHYNDNYPNFLEEFPYVKCEYYYTGNLSPTFQCTAFDEEYLSRLYVSKTHTNYYLIGRTEGESNVLEFSISRYGVLSTPAVYARNTATSSTFYLYTSSSSYYNYTNFDPTIITGSDSSFGYELNTLDFSEYMTKYDVQVDTWNGYGYDYYTNQVGIIDMRKDTYILNSHTCPNDGEFVSGYTGDTNDICYWSYNNDLSDYLVFYFNARNYDSENVEWSNITFLKDHTYTLNFTLYGLVDAETLSSIQFSLEGALTQEIFSTSFTKILRESMDEKTYLTFAITPTEDIEMDHFFLKFNSNGSYAQTIGANRLWTYKDYTNVPIEQIQIEQTDKLLMQNEQLKDLINNPFVNSESVDNFWDKFEHKDYGLTQIITAPINTIKKISNGTCTPYNVTILGKTIELPCGDTLFWNREDVESFKTFWNMFWGGILCYGIGKLIIKDVQKATNPNSDKLEVIDL